MPNIWIKLYIDHEISRHDVFACAPESFKSDLLLAQGMHDICLKLDEPIPIILDKHIKDLNQFGRTVFRNNDFLENIDFDYMELEVLKEEKKKKKF